MKEKKERILFLYCKAFAYIGMSFSVFYSICAMGMTIVPIILACTMWIVDFANLYHVHKYTGNRSTLIISGQVF